jgi:mono/diheme cytochrome c family protein
MKNRLCPLARIGGGALMALGLAGCAATPPAGPVTGEPAVVTRALEVIETRCVHCHGEQRLVMMPALGDLDSLRGLIGEAGLMVPGRPEASRFFTVVTLADDQPGAMPPSGHAIPVAEVSVLRAWIRQGAVVPPGNRVLRPRGEAPRST